jgi:hypothetical protein
MNITQGQEFKFSYTVHCTVIKILKTNASSYCHALQEISYTVYESCFLQSNGIEDCE